LLCIMSQCVIYFILFLIMTAKNTWFLRYSDYFVSMNRKSGVNWFVDTTVLSSLEFLAWKHAEETRTVSRFVKNHGAHNTTIEHYYCSRSGSFQSKGTKKRHLKIQGTCKVGSKCPASITAAFTPRGTYNKYFF